LEDVPSSITIDSDILVALFIKEPKNSSLRALSIFLVLLVFSLFFHIFGALFSKKR